jgi:hypothetical protein
MVSAPARAMAGEAKMVRGLDALAGGLRRRVGVAGQKAAVIETAGCAGYIAKSVDRLGKVSGLPRKHGGQA